MTEKGNIRKLVRNLRKAKEKGIETPNELRASGKFGKMKTLSGEELLVSENPITTSSWKDVREEVKRWCDE